MNDKLYLTTSEAAKMLNVSVGTLRNYQRKGYLKPDIITISGYRKYKPETIQDFIKGGMYCAKDS